MPSKSPLPSKLPARGDKEPHPPHLTIGSTYRIFSLGSRDEMLETRGVFKGVATVGTIDGLALELNDFHGAEWKGKFRVIPSHMVLAIDILEQAASPEESSEEVHMHYT